MRYLRITRLLISVLLMLTASAFAKTLYVGSCHTPNYPTISAAVAAAPAGATIDVCPGTYSEQVFITQELTLQGITSSGDDFARIVVPANLAGGPTNWVFVTDPATNAPVAPQIYVNSTAGTVKITNLMIDGTGEVGAPACGAAGSWSTVAIYAWTSVTINEVNTLGQGQTSCGIGIYGEQANAAAIPSITIEHSSVQIPSSAGISLSSPSDSGTGTTVSVTNNTVEMSSSLSGASALLFHGITGTISSNTLLSGTYGIQDAGNNSALTISGNTLVSPSPPYLRSSGGESTSNSGVWVAAVDTGSVTYSDNKIVGFSWGFVVETTITDNPLTLKNNAVVNSFVAFQLGCGQTLSGNTINNADAGFNAVPMGFSTTGAVSLYNVNIFIVTSIGCP